MSSISTESPHRSENEDIFDAWDRACCNENTPFAGKYIKYLTSLRLAIPDSETTPTSLIAITAIARQYHESKIFIPMGVDMVRTSSPEQQIMLDRMKQAIHVLNIVPIDRYIDAIRDPQYTTMSDLFHTSLPALAAYRNTSIINRMFHSYMNGKLYNHLSIGIEQVLNGSIGNATHITVDINYEKNGIFSSEITPSFDTENYEFPNRGPHTAMAFVGRVTEKHQFQPNQFPHICHIAPFPLRDFLSGVHGQYAMECMLQER